MSKIKGKSKLATAAGPSAEKEETGKLELTKVRKKVMQKTYRLYPDDIARMKKVVEKMNGATHKNISENAAIRALIALGMKTSGEKLINALRDTL